MRTFLWLAIFLIPSALLGENRYFGLDAEQSDSFCPEKAYLHSKNTDEGEWLLLVLYEHQEKFVKVHYDVEGVVAKEYSRSGSLIKYTASVTKDGDLVFFKKSVQKANRRFRWFEHYSFTAMLSANFKLSFNLNGRRNKTMSCNYSLKKI